MIPADRIAAEFPFACEVVYLNTAAEGLLPRSGRDALLRYADDKARGDQGRPAMYSTEARLRSQVGGLLGARADQVAFVPSTARGIDAVLGAIAWRPGDNVVTGDAEFPTSITGPLRLADRGVETRVVHAVGGQFDHGALERHLDARTRLVIVSQVSFRTGFRVDLARIGAVARDRGALLLVDATQAFGVVPVSLAPADFLVASTFKWALAVHGAALLAIADTVRDTEPAFVGWRGISDLFEPIHHERYTLWSDARRFEEGMPGFGALYTLEASLGVLADLGPDTVGATVAARVAAVIAGLERLGIETLASPEPSERAGIVAFETGQAPEIAAQLSRGGVYVWGRDGRVRISPHVYTSAADIDTLLERLAAVLGR